VISIEIMYLAVCPDPRTHGDVIHLYCAVSHSLVGTLAGHSELIDHLTFASTGDRLVSCSRRDGTVRIWDVASMTEATCLLIGEDKQPSQACFSPDDNSLVVHCEDGVRAYDLRTQQLTFEYFREGAETIYHAIFCPDSERILMSMSRLAVDDEAAGSAYNHFRPEAFSVNVFDIESGDYQLLVERRTRSFGTGAMACVPGQDNYLALAIYGRGTIEIFDTTTGQATREFYHPHHVDTICFSANGRMMAASHMKDTVVIVWEFATGNLVLEVAISKVYKLSFNSDGSRLVCSCDPGGVRIIDVGTGETVHCLEESANGCYSTAVTILM
jgi:WD40 repeat protein